MSLGKPRKSEQSKLLSFLIVFVCVCVYVLGISSCMLKCLYSQWACVYSQTYVEVTGWQWSLLQTLFYLIKSVSLWSWSMPAIVIVVADHFAPVIHCFCLRNVGSVKATTPAGLNHMFWASKLVFMFAK